MTRHGLLIASLVSLCACGPEALPDGNVKLSLVRGDADPLMDPGTAARAASPVGSVEIKWSSARETFSETVAVDGSRELRTRFLPEELAEVARVTLRGLRASDGALYSAARSLPFTVTSGEERELVAFIGPVEAFTPVGPDMPGARLGAAVATLKDEGALIVGGFEPTATGVVLADPAVVFYKSRIPQACGAGAGCLTGDQPPPRRGAIAVSLTDGNVLHGLGRTAIGVDGTLWLTQPDGRTEKLTLAGDALTPLVDASAVALSDGAVLVLGGDDGTNAVSSVFRVDPKTRTVVRQPAMKVARRKAAAVLLSNGQVFIGGGEGLGGPLATAEVFTPGQGSEEVDGGAFTQVRPQMKGPRIAPSIARMPDDTVIVWGGGLDGGEAFRLDLGIRVGGFVDVIAPPLELRSKAPALVRMTSGELLLVGGEASGAVASFGAIFSPDPDQTLNTATPVYTGTYRPIGAPASIRWMPALTELTDGTVLVVGGGTLGERPETVSNPAARRVELLVPNPGSGSGGS